MRTFAKILVSLLIEIGCILGGLLIGMWLPVADLPPEGPGPGAGLAVILFGAIGAVIGAVVGVCCILFFRSAVRRIGRRKNHQVACPSENVWPPPPSNTAD